MALRRVAVVAFNLGGPDGPKAVRPFLFNLFNDRAIISAPQPIRFLLAALISTLRAPTARANYAIMGGGSSILPETQKQAEALDRALAKKLEGAGVEAKTFIAMRYWKPFAADAAAAAKAWGADEAILAPLYPQFAGSTTGSAIHAWRQAWDKPSRTLCCYPDATGFAQAHADAILKAWRDGGAPENPRVLFSAHGLPKRTVEAGDPYQWQVERTVAAVVKLLPPEWEHRICYQSRVGPLEWLGPATEDEIRAAGTDQRGVVLSPIAFVSEHVETLVELDHEYGDLAKEAGLPYYLRAPALGYAEPFIEALADMILCAISDERPIRSHVGARICPATFSQCPHAGAAA